MHKSVNKFFRWAVYEWKMQIERVGRAPKKQSANNRAFVHMKSFIIVFTKVSASAVLIYNINCDVEAKITFSAWVFAAAKLAGRKQTALNALRRFINRSSPGDLHRFVVCSTVRIIRWWRIFHDLHSTICHHFPAFNCYHCTLFIRPVDPIITFSCH